MLKVKSIKKIKLTKQENNIHKTNTEKEVIDKINLKIKRDKKIKEKNRKKTKKLRKTQNLK